jgi:hypothetical protein
MANYSQAQKQRNNNNNTTRSPRAVSLPIPDILRRHNPENQHRHLHCRENLKWTIGRPIFRTASMSSSYIVQNITVTKVPHFRICYHTFSNMLPYISTWITYKRR